MRTDSTPCRANWAAKIVPDAPPPTIATFAWPLDFVVRPGLRICGASFALGHMVVHVRDGLAGCLSENARHDRMDDASKPGADQPAANCHCSDAMSCPAHPERARVFQEQAVGHSRALLGLLLRRHRSRPQKSGDPDRIRTCGPQIRNLM